MHRFRFATAALLLLMILCAAPLSLGESGLKWVNTPDTIRPGKSIQLSFSATLSGDVDILVKDKAGTAVAAIAESFSAKAGKNSVIWDGQADGSPLSPGTYQLQVVQGKASATAPVQIGEVSPVILSAIPDSPTLPLGGTWTLEVETNLAATLTLKLDQGSDDIVLYEQQLPAGIQEIAWDGTVNGQALAPGSYSLTLQLTDDSGFSSNGEQFPVTIEDASKATPVPSATAASDGEATTQPGDSAPSPTPFLTEIISANDSGSEKVSAPSDFSSYTCPHTSCFFKLPMGVLDEAAIWDAMMQPITVVKGEQRQVVKVYAEPSKDSKAVGEVTCDSQGLHVIENLDSGWSLVEAYSSSIHSSKVKNWAGFFSGYIETSKLETKEPNKKYGLLLDKLTQRMYVFQEGKIITELLISTGLVNDEQPYNETPAGDFVIVSWTGGFWSGNMWCDLALRVNGGILIHEVPCFKSEDEVRDYGPFKRVLGQKASHGCIRVQEEKSAEGINMKWLWDNLKINTRVFIWDDVGRNIPVPADDYPLYFNPDGGKYYHNDAYCKGVKNKYLPLTGFTYGELETSPYDKLNPCPSCTPPKRKAEIEALNAGNR